MKNKLTIKQYAEFLNISVSGVQKRIDRGTLKSTFDGVVWVFPNSDKTKRVGRPNKNEK